MSNLHVAWSQLLFRGFAAAGVTDVVVSPGSRSTPLALAAAASSLRVHVVVDERQAAFFALGQARITGRPSVVVCTSGTAAAHYLPALLEAREAYVPLVVLTADRPWEAQHVHSAQTTDQTKLFGDAVRGFFGLGLPDEAGLAGALRTAQQAVARSRGPVPGGVHVNAPFRKPLEPKWGEPVPQVTQHTTSVLETEARLSRAGREALARTFAAAKRILFLAGPSMSVHDARDSMRAALARTGGVLVADPTSGLRAAGSLRHGETLVPLLEGDAAPDLVVTLGLPMVSTALQNWLARSTIPRVVIAPHGWPDPWGTASMLVPLEVGAALDEIVESSGDPTWRASVHAADAALEVAQCEAFERGALVGLHEASIARALGRSNRVTLVVGNSLPVRDLDVFGGQSTVRHVHQRGVAGIDGLLAGAAGTASVAGPTVLHVGDVSFLHDAGALALLATVKTPLVIVAVNNDGGRIFEELPVARNAELAGPLRDLFVTPHGHDLARIATGFGVTAARVSSLAELDAALAVAVAAPRCTVIEARVSPAGDLRRAWRETATALARATLRPA